MVTKHNICMTQLLQEAMALALVIEQVKLRFKNIFWQHWKPVTHQVRVEIRLGCTATNCLVSHKIRKNWVKRAAEKDD